MTRTVRVLVQNLPIVDYDRALHTIRDEDIERICAILARDPLYGEFQPDGRREMVYQGLQVSYICIMEEGLVTVTITGIRPKEQASRTGRVLDGLKRFAAVLLSIKGLLK